MLQLSYENEIRCGCVIYNVGCDKSFSLLFHVHINKYSSWLSCDTEELHFHLSSLRARETERFKTNNSPQTLSYYSFCFWYFPQLPHSVSLVLIRYSFVIFFPICSPYFLPSMFKDGVIHYMNLKQISWQLNIFHDPLFFFCWQA